MMLDVAHRHPTRIQRDDHVVEAAGASGALGHQPRLERPGPVTRGVQRNVTDLGGQGLRGTAVARVRAAAPGRVALLIAQVPAQLGAQATLQHRSDHLREEPSDPGQAQPVAVDPVHHLVEQPRIEHLVDRLPGLTRLRRGRHAQRVPSLLVIGHGHHMYSFSSGGASVHRPFDTPPSPANAPQP
jgi:hypothetical protein